MKRSKTIIEKRNTQHPSHHWMNGVIVVLILVLIIILVQGFFDNNRAATVGGNVVGGSSAHGADLIVSRIIVSRTAESIQGVYGYKYLVAVIIKNIGTAPVSRPFNILVTAPGYDGDLQRTNRKFSPKWGGTWIEGGKVLMPGEEIGGAWLYPVYLRELGATYEVSATVDSSSEIRESNEDNNKLVKHFTLYMELGQVPNVQAID
ncbi:hypothetical protein HYX02_02210 [Candidatus Woesearchaeota archaeon]|nr:hypothetical protein [Candidatus Woesearchaeota archaeon]